MKKTTHETHYMKNMVLLCSTKYETLYHKDHGATLKHKCGKRIVALSLLFFIWPFFFYLAFIFLFGLCFFICPFLGQCSIEWWSSHLYLFTTQWLQLGTRTKYDSVWMPPVVYREGQWIKSDMYDKLCMVALKYDVNYMIMQSNTTMMKRVINEMVESCMAIYLGMAMEMS